MYFTTNSEGPYSQKADSFTDIVRVREKRTSRTDAMA
jgi:hypothetical protein